MAERGGKEGGWCNLLLSNSIPPAISLPKSLAVNGFSGRISCPGKGFPQFIPVTPGPGPENVSGCWLKDGKRDSLYSVY